MGLTGKVPLQTNWAFGTGHTGTDAIKVSIVADGPARILHTGMGSGDLERAKCGKGQPT